MRLIKSMASQKGESQKDVQMHPIEELEIRAHWEAGEYFAKRPEPLSPHEEMDLLINEGIESVKAKREEQAKAYTEWKVGYDKLVAKRIECEEAWKKHCDRCACNGLDPDTHDIEKYMHLIADFRD